MRAFNFAFALTCVALAAAEGDFDMASLSKMMGGGGDEGGGMEELMAKMGGMGGMMGGDPPPQPITGVATDVPFVQCATCKVLVKHSISEIKRMRDALKTTALSEETILDQLNGDPGYGKPNAPPHISGGVCNVDSPDGEWMHWYDMVEDEAARTIQLKKMDEAGRCGVECKTIAIACSETLALIDSPFAEALYLNTKGAKELELAVCGAPGQKGWTSSLDGSCSDQPAPLTPEERAVGEAFVPKPAAAHEDLDGAKKKKRRRKKKTKAAKEDKAEL